MSNIVGLYIDTCCQQCGCHWGRVERRRMNTAYHDDELNYCEVCEDCFKEIQEQWAEMWADYYRSIL